MHPGVVEWEDVVITVLGSFLDPSNLDPVRSPGVWRAIRNGAIQCILHATLFRPLDSKEFIGYQFPVVRILDSLPEPFGNRVL